MSGGIWQRSLRNLRAIRISPGLAFLVLALAVLGPLLGPGRLLTLDSPLAINMDIAGYFWGTGDGPSSVFAATYNSAVFALILKTFAFVVPYWLVEKAWLVLLFWLCGVGGSRLPYLDGIGRYYAGILYAVNPFTYIRFVAGQWGILGAYALMPFAVTAFCRLLEEPQPKNAVKVALILTVIGFFQIHGLALAGLVLGALYLGRIVFTRGSFWDTLPMLALSLVIFLGVNAFWIVRFAVADGGAVGNMPVAELSYFAAFSPLDALSLRGSWLPGIYLDISDLVQVWWIIFLPLFFLVIYGAVVTLDITHLRWLTLGLAVTGLLSIVLAIGPGVPTLRFPFEWLWEEMPLYRAFRDSHKFVGLLVLVYAYFGATGLQAFWYNASRPNVRIKWLPHVGAGFVFLLALAYSLPLFGAWGQIKPVEFPEDWHQTRSILEADSEDYNILVLPWHMYMDFKWLPNRWKKLVNPGPNFFTKPVISGDNLEIPVSFSDSSNPQSKYVESLLRRRDSLEGFGEMIAPLNAKYVVLFKTADYRSYDFLGQQEDLQAVFEGENITLFRNLNPVGRVYAVNGVVGVGNLDDYFAATSSQDPLGNLYVLGSDTPQVVPDGLSASGSRAQLKVTEAGPLSYDVEQSNGGYLVLALPQHTARSGWAYNGQKPDITNLDMMPAFRVMGENGSITFTRFYRLYLPAYILAVLSLVAAAVVYRRWR